jgi:hypothetical protein
MLAGAAVGAALYLHTWAGLPLAVAAALAAGSGLAFWRSKGRAEFDAI